MNQIAEIESRGSAAPAVKGSIDHNLGRLLIDSGKLSDDEVRRILEFSKKKGLRFGEAAVRLNLLKKDDVDRALAAQFDHTYLTQADDAFSKELIAAYMPHSAKVEALKSLRVQLMLGSFQSTGNVLAIVSPGAGEGRSFISANLAVVFSQLGERTLLIDAHLQNSRQHAIFHLPQSVGLSAVLAGRASGVPPLVVVPHFKNLSVLPAGAPPPNADELIAGDHFTKVIAKAREKFDVVIVDTPPADTSAAADWIVARCGMAVMVARRGRTRLRDARRFAERMRSRGRLIGCVLNKV